MPGHTSGPTTGGPGDFGNVDAALGIDAYAMRRVEIARFARMLAAAPTRDQGSTPIEDADTTPGFVRRCVTGSRPAPGVKPQFGNVCSPRRIEGDLRWSGKIRPFSDELAIGRELLDPGIFPVADMDRAPASIAMPCGT